MGLSTGTLRAKHRHPKIIMIYPVDSIEEIEAIRRAILECASELMAAVNCENRFNERLIDSTMSTLADVITDVNEDLEGAWFSARVRVPGDAPQMLTTPEYRKVSN
jgi:hypothetical protein